MSDSTEPESTDKSGKPKKSTISCADAGVLTSAFVAGGLKRDAVKLLHRHLDGCTECKDGYRAALEAVGRLGQSLRKSKEPDTSRETTAERHKRIVGLANATRKGKKRPFALRALMVTAGMVFLFAALSKFMDFPNTAELSWLAGDVGIGDSVISAETEPLQLVAANWCWTGENSRGRLNVDKLTIELGSLTQLLLEDRDDLNFVLRTGKLEVDGQCNITTTRGVVRVLEGLVSISLKSGQLDLGSSGGQLELVSSTGTQRVSPDDPNLTINSATIAAATPFERR